MTGVKQSRTYPGADVGQDHNPLVVNMKVKQTNFKLNKKQTH